MLVNVGSRPKVVLLALVSTLLILGVAVVPVAASSGIAGGSGPEGAGQPSVSSAPAARTYYVVRYGDTLSGIARQFGTTVGALMAENGIADPNRIRVGQVLCIPGGGPGGPRPGDGYIVCAGDTLYSIAVRFGTTVQAIAQANGIVNPSRIYAGQRLVVPGGWTPRPSPVRTYVVQRGDTLSCIALRFGTSVAHLLVVNNLMSPNRIYAGQVLCL